MLPFPSPKPAFILAAAAVAGCAVLPPGLFAQAQASMPFKTVLVDDGPGQWIAAGADERAVVRSRAELDAFLARHPRFQPAIDPAVPLAPLPEALTGLDFGVWQAIALVDGQVDLVTSSRITAVVDLGDRLEVRTQRWVAPPGPTSGPSPTGRIHVVAVPRSDKPVVFAAIAEVDGLAKEGENGWGVGGGPPMNPRWRAVPNPDLTREQVEATFRAMMPGATVTAFSVEKRTIGWVAANLLPNATRGHFTPESEVWVLRAEGDLPVTNPDGMRAGAGLGGMVPRQSRVAALVSIEDLVPRPYLIDTTPFPGDPGFTFQLQPAGDLVLGDALTFTTSGRPVAGTFTLRVLVGAAPPVERVIPFADLATFRLPLDRETLPALADASVQAIELETQYTFGSGGGAPSRTPIRLFRDRAAREAQ